MSSLRSIDDLNKKEYKFVIPSYQRGYRWTSEQVIDLLDDIKEFKSNEDRTNFYCVQPIVVQKQIDEYGYRWIVIDGQQRLTTIYIIMSYIITVFPIYEINFELFYDTRKESKEFLENISKDEYRNKMKDKYIDFHFMAEAYETIREWFGDDRNTIAKLAMEIMDKLLEQVKFIWYEIDDDEDPIEIFTRINLGKIPLTDSELIKALLLKKDNFTDKDKSSEYTRLKQLEIASEWNIIENNLQEDSFWYFINGSDKYETRIEFLFEVLVKVTDNLVIQNREYKWFHSINEMYSRKLEDLGKVEAIDYIWSELKKIYYTLEEWYGDRTFYHYIGFLIVEGNLKLPEIINLVKGLNKDDSLEAVVRRIGESIDPKGELGELEDLKYSKNGSIIRKLLLLFNIETLEKNDAYYRFPFDLYKKEKWDLEHIHAISQDIPSRKDHKDKFLEMILENEYLSREKEGKKIQEKAKKMLDGTIKLRFEEFYTEVIKQYGVNNDNDSLSNIALLDSSTNRSYKNLAFPMKREIIIKNDKAGKFIPVCTKNVFLKYYSKDLGQMDFWSEDDELDYISAMEEVLLKFMNNEGDENGSI